MNDPVYQKLLETSWRRKLTPDEQARLQDFLSAHPEARADWQAQSALNGLLRQLPAAPLASNFTAQVLRAVAAEQTRRSRRSGLARWWEDWSKVLLPRAAWAGVALLLGLAATQEYRHLNRVRIARDLSQVPVVAELPAPEVFEDFDAIQQMCKVAVPPRSSAGVTDEDLLAALQ